MSDNLEADDNKDWIARIPNQDAADGDLHHDLFSALDELGVDGNAFEVSMNAERTNDWVIGKFGLLVLPLTAISIAILAAVTWSLFRRAWTEWTSADYSQVARTFGQWVLTFGLVFFAAGVVAFTTESFVTRRNHGRKLALKRLKEAHAAVSGHRSSDLDGVARALSRGEARLAMTVPGGHTISLRQHRRSWLLATAREVAMLEADLGPHYLDADRWRHRQVLARAMCRVHYDEWPSEPPPTSDVEHFRSLLWTRRLLAVGGAIGVAIPVLSLLLQTYEWLQPR